MYDAQLTLAAIDRNAIPILALCGFAMLCNYTWFIIIVRRGFRDRVYPEPLFCTFFWLAGDGSMVLRFDEWFHVYDHWYLKLFWGALVLTVACELIFVYMILRFGRAELTPSWSQRRFTALVLVALAVTFVIWGYVKRLIGDPLYIDYFHLANMAGPIFSAMLLLKRRSLAGTSTFVWVAYTFMVLSWFIACALWFGPHFATPPYLVFYATCTLCSLGMIYLTRHVPTVAAYTSN